MTDSVETSFVYDSNGTVIAKLTGSENVDRIYVAYTEVKNTYIDEAIMAIEDERFSEHSGIDVKRIGSAVLSALVQWRYGFLRWLHDYPADCQVDLRSGSAIYFA